MGLRPTKVMKTRCGKIGWQAEAPAPRWPEWGRRFRLPTGVFNGVGAFFVPVTETFHPGKKSHSRG